VRQQEEKAWEENVPCWPTSWPAVPVEKVELPVPPKNDAPAGTGRGNAGRGRASRGRASRGSGSSSGSSHQAARDAPAGRGGRGRGRGRY
jgi:hypothetical protein